MSLFFWHYSGNESDKHCAAPLILSGHDSWPKTTVEDPTLVKRNVWASVHKTYDQIRAKVEGAGGRQHFTTPRYYHDDVSNTPDTGSCTVRPISSVRRRSAPADPPPAARTEAVLQERCTTMAAETRTTKWVSAAWAQQSRLEKSVGIKTWNTRCINNNVSVEPCEQSHGSKSNKDEPLHCYRLLYCSVQSLQTALKKTVILCDGTQESLVQRSLTVS